MNILILTYEYPPIGGGGGIGASQYAEAWAQAGHRVRVVTSRARGLHATEEKRGVEIVRVAAPGRKERATATTLSMLAYNVTGLLHIIGNLRQYRAFDVVNTHFSIPTGPMASVAVRLLGRPHVLTIIGGDIYDPTKRTSPHRSRLLRQLNRWIIGAADRVIAISSDTRDRARSLYGIDRPIEVINYGFLPFETGADPGADEPPPGLDPDAYHLIAVGRLVPRKGFDHLIRALGSLPRNIELVLIGDGPEGAHLRALAREEGVADRLHLLGFRSRGEIDRYLRFCDCFVLSSLHEGLGIVVQEAMDRGLPVVATDNGGQRDLIRQDRNGLLVEPGQPRALADAIRRIHENPDLALRMGDNNRADIRKLYMNRNAGLYLDVFEEVAARAEAGRTPSIA